MSRNRSRASARPATSSAPAPAPALEVAPVTTLEGRFNVLADLIVNNTTCTTTLAVVAGIKGSMKGIPGVPGLFPDQLPNWEAGIAQLHHAAVNAVNGGNLPEDVGKQIGFAAGMTRGPITPTVRSAASIAIASSVRDGRAFVTPGK